MGQSLPKTVSALLDEVPKALEREAKKLQPFHGNWWFDGTRAKGLASRREAHLVFAVASALQAQGRTVILDDGFEGPWASGNYRKRCDLAVLLPTVVERWLWVEFKSMPVEDMRDKLEAARADVEKLVGVAKSSVINRPQALVLVGFAHGDEGARKMSRSFEAFGRQELARWSHRAASFAIDCGEQGHDRCVVDWWFRC